ncbi:hypothetical protein JCM8547_005613 [Rhodosporidiobolus lusitaniae]
MELRSGWDSPPTKSAPSLTPSRKRRLSFKILKAPFRRSTPAEPEPPVFPIPLPDGTSPLDHPTPNEPTKAVSTRTKSLRTPSLLSRKFRRRSLGLFGTKMEKPLEELETPVVVVEEEEIRPPRSTINWVKRTDNQPLPSEAATIREQWLKKQHFERPAPQIAVELDHRASIGSVGSLLFPSTTPGQQLRVFTPPPPRAVSPHTQPNADYSSYPSSTISTTSQQDELLRGMAKPFPSRAAHTESAQQALPSATPEEEVLPFMFPVPPHRQTDLPTPPASPHAGYPTQLASPLPMEKSDLAPPIPFDTPPHTPQRSSFVEGGMERQASAPTRRASTLTATDFAATSPAEPRRPQSLVVGPTSSTVPIFTRGTGNPFNRLSHGRSASVALPSTSSSSTSLSIPASALGNATSILRRPVSIAPGMGGRRMSASLASTIGAPGGANRQSWASMQSQASSIGSTVSQRDGAGGGRGLLDEVRRRADERERRGKVHRRNESNATVQPEQPQQKWQPVPEIREKKDADLPEEERREWEHEAEEMFSDARMEALVRELGF